MRGMKRLFTVPVALVALAVTESASAHGLPGDSAETVPEFVALGVFHMLAGWDHLLFIGGVVLLARTIGRAAKLVSVFVAGHSLTLLVATLAGWQVNATLVDVVIALSVVYVGVVIVRGRPESWTEIGLAVFGFGLAHGLGLSTRLQELDLPSGGALVARVLAFNVGVEIGQLAALTALVAVVALARKFAPRLHVAPRLAGSGLAIVGVAAAVAVAALAISADAEPTPSGVGACTEEASSPPRTVPFGSHPTGVFFAPGARLPTEDDLSHVMLDGYLIVRYRSSLPPADRGRLETWSSAGDGLGLVVVPDQGLAMAIEATNREFTLTCDRLDIDRLEEFRADWFDL